MILELVISLGIGLLEKHIERMKEKGKPLKAVKKIMSDETEEKLHKLLELYTMVKVSLEDELAEEHDS